MTTSAGQRLLLGLLVALLCASGALTALVLQRSGTGGASVASAPLRDPPLVADPGGYTFLSPGDDGQPVRWDPCRPIQVVVRPAGEPTGGRAAVLAALEDVGVATGLVLQVRGETDEAPSAQRPATDTARYGDGWSPVLLAWSDPVEYPPLAGAIGVAGPVAVEVPGGPATYVSGTVVLDAAWFGENLARAEGSRRAAAVLRHELAHLVGLGHSQDPFSLMSPAYQSAYQLSLSDRAGLARLGDGPCSTPTA